MKVLGLAHCLGIFASIFQVRDDECNYDDDDEEEEEGKGREV